MTIGPATSAVSGVPAVDTAAEPEWIRKGSAATQSDYRAALSFEQTLVEQLAKSMAATTGTEGEESSEGEEGQGGSSQPAPLSSMLPQALSSGIMSSGGLGMAAQLTRGLIAGQGITDHAAAPAVTAAGGSIAPGGTT